MNRGLCAGFTLKLIHYIYLWSVIVFRWNWNSLVQGSRILIWRVPPVSQRIVLSWKLPISRNSYIPKFFCNRIRRKFFFIRFYFSLMLESHFNPVKGRSISKNLRWGWWWTERDVFKKINWCKDSQKTYSGRNHSMVQIANKY